MLTAIMGIAPEWFIPTSQEEEDEPARFKLKPLDQMAFIEVVSLSELNADGMLIPNAEARRLLLKKGLMDWENIEDPNGKDLKYSPHNIKVIPFQELFEICNQILTISAPGEEERKN